MPKQHENFDEMLADLSAQTAKMEKEKEKAEKKDKPKVTDKSSSTAGPSELNRFRYMLTLLLVSVKLGLFAYLDPNPLADLPWLLVFLPAYAIEAVMGAFIVVAVLGVAVGLVFMYGFFGIQSLARRFRDRKASTVFPTVDKTNW